MILVFFFYIPSYFILNHKRLFHQYIFLQRKALNKHYKKIQQNIHEAANKNINIFKVETIYIYIYIYEIRNSNTPDLSTHRDEELGVFSKIDFSLLFASNLAHFLR